MQVQKQIDELLALRASEWFELLPAASPEQLQAFEAWLSESRLHVQEFLEIAEVEFSLQDLDRRRSHNVETLLRRIGRNVAPLPRRATAGAWRTARRGWKIAGLAAACAAIGLSWIFLFAVLGGAKEYQTAIGEQRIVELADNSLVTLNADSEINVHLLDSERKIDLQRGEAIFKVAYDALRPFRVHTRAGIVQAVGTQFGVHDRLNGDTRVSVLEGRVRLTAKRTEGAAQPEQLLLAAGEEADIRLDGTIRRHENAVVADSVAWRERRLVFENAPLEEMVLEFNRHNPNARLRLENLQGDERRYDGVFEATDPESLVALLAKDPDLEIRARGGEIIIRRR